MLLFPLAPQFIGWTRHAEMMESLNRAGTSKGPICKALLRLPPLFLTFPYRRLLGEQESLKNYTLCPPLPPPALGHNIPNKDSMVKVASSLITSIHCRHHTAAVVVVVDDWWLAVLTGSVQQALASSEATVVVEVVVFHSSAAGLWSIRRTGPSSCCRRCWC